MIPWFKQGKTGWLLLGAGVLAWDWFAPDDNTLSESFRRAKRHPVTATATGVAWGLLTAHLWGILPPRADPLHQIHVARDYRRERRCAETVARVA